MPPEEHYRKLERMYTSAPTNQYYAPTLQISQGQAVVTIPADPKHFHAAGAVHGAIYFKALDDSAFFAVNSLVEDVFVLTVAFTVYLTRPISSGVMKATGRVVHTSRRLYLAESELVDGEGVQIARGNGAFMRSKTPLSHEIGYV
jgi:uncharacterized protein (TIGR00369 family)